MTKDFRPRSFKQTQSGVSTLNYITPSAALNSGVSSTFSNDVQTMSKLIELAAPIAFFTCWVMTDDIFLSTQVLMVMISFQAIIEYADQQQFSHGFERFRARILNDCLKGDHDHEDLRA